jgi:hypothetical protein
MWSGMSNVAWKVANRDARPSGSLGELKAQLDLVETAGRYTSLQRRGRAWWGRCPLHTDRTPSFKIDPERQRFHCFGCRRHGDVLDLVAAAERVDLATAIALVRDRAGDGPQGAPWPAAPPMPAARGLSTEAADLWASCRPIVPGTPAAAYLVARGCALPHPDGDLRWHPRQRHPYCAHAGPVLVVHATDVLTLEPLTLQRTWIAGEGSKNKAPIKQPRLNWPGLSAEGGVVRLWPDEEITLGLCLAEGVETGLTAALGYGLAWATLGSGNLAAFPVLDGIEALTIVEDRDQAGIAAAAACAARWTAAGREVRVWRSATPGRDFNDHLSGGAA